MHARVLFKLALLAPPLYLAAVVWGSSITPGYSHRHQAISELTQRGAANTGPVEALFVLSALCVAALGAGCCASGARIAACVWPDGSS